MKRIFLGVLLAFSCASGLGSHIKGGYFTYEYKGPGLSDVAASRYDITLTVYMGCNPTSNQVDPSINFSFFNTATGLFIRDKNVVMSQRYEISKITDEPCITGNQIACYYTIITYKLSNYELSPLPEGYTISFQRCCRINNMENLDNSGTVGNTWTIAIPGNNTPGNGEKNSSPQFTINDTAVVCENSYFSFPFKAFDPNGDSLSYSFCEAFQGAGIGGASPPTATAPPYYYVPYTAPFFGSQPMGPGVTINAVTGLISGIAPGIVRGSGEYVVCVCIAEFRNGIQIGETRKELHIKVGSCNVIEANLNPEYNSCNSFTQTFTNNSPSTDIISNFWDFGVAGVIADTSNVETPIYTYADTGRYVLTLIVNKGQQCSDTSTGIVRIYPGFDPGFTTIGTCINTPIRFTDTTFTRYGVVDSWDWDFGDPTTINDRSTLPNPTYVYANPGVYPVKLTVTNSKGCRKVITRQINIIENPKINLLYRQSANCGQDTLTMGATADVPCIFTWSPLVNIINSNSAGPQVYPVVPTTYYVHADAGGCSSRDSVFIDVVSSVNVDAGNDTTICQTDAVRINTVSNGIYFTWTPSESLNDPTVKNPLAMPDSFTTYVVIGRVGKCRDTADISISVVPYPKGNAGRDTSLCFAGTVQLHASGGNEYKWSPLFHLSNPVIANPLASPPRTTLYKVSVRDTLSSCPKATVDSILITIYPKLKADAGPRDTAVVVNQPLQLIGSGGSSYSWSPATGLSNPAIKNPVARLFENRQYVLTILNQEKCSATDTIDIIVFKVNPGLYVPTGFTPNGDGVNDLFRPILVGMKTLTYFRVYDRWGKQMFSSTSIGQGWNGKFGGKEQDAGTFVWMTEGVDHTGRRISERGYVILIR